jgi:hypothetical protein
MMKISLQCHHIHLAQHLPIFYLNSFLTVNVTKKQPIRYLDLVTPVKNTQSTNFKRKKV